MFLTIFLRPEMSNLTITDSTQAAAIEAFIQETFEKYVQGIHLEYPVLKLCQ